MWDMSNTVSVFLKETHYLFQICGVEKAKNRKIVLATLLRIFLLFSLFIYPVFLIMDAGSTKVDIISGYERLILSSIHFESPLMIFAWYSAKEELQKRMDDIQNLLMSSGLVDTRIKKIFVNENGLKMRILRGIGSFSVITILLAVCGWLIRFFFYIDKFTIQVTENNKTVTKYSKQVPFPIWVPFDYEKSIITYVLLGVLGAFPMLLHAVIITGFDGVVLSSISFGIAHFKILKHIFKKTYKRCNQNVRTKNFPFRMRVEDEINAEMQGSIKNCGLYLISVLEYCCFIEESFNKMFLVIILHSVGLIVFCLVTVVNTPFTDEKFLMYVIFTVTMLCALFFLCDYGNRLTKAAESIAFGLYENNWLTTSNSYKKSMIIILLRLQKPVHLTIGKFFPITLYTFIQVIKLGYSCLAVTMKGISTQ